MDMLHVKFPYEIRDVDAKNNAELLKYFTGERTGFVQVGPEGYFFPHKYKEHAEMYYNFKARPDDVWIVTVPRSGTTWTQEMIWLLANNMDFEQAENRLLIDRFSYFEYALCVHDDVAAEFLAAKKDPTATLDADMRLHGYETIDKLPKNQRRFIKTHFPFSLLPPSVLQNKCKIIYVNRNPKDVAVSYYHLNRLLRHHNYIGDFERFWMYFQKGLCYWLPYYSHVKEAKKHSHLSNVLFLKYEDMWKDLPGSLKNIADFLDCEMPKEEGLNKLINHLNIENFRKSRCLNMDILKEWMNEGEDEFLHKGDEGTNGKLHDKQEFLDNPNLLKIANDWIRQNNE